MGRFLNYFLIKIKTHDGHLSVSTSSFGSGTRFLLGCLLFGGIWPVFLGPKLKGTSFSKNVLGVSLDFVNSLSTVF